MDFFTIADADDIGELAGLGNALEAVGWITFSASGAVVSNWDRHNGESAKKRAMKSERQRRWRDGGVDAPASTRASTR